MTSRGRDDAARRWRTSLERFTRWDRYRRLVDRVAPHASRIVRLTAAAVFAYLLAKAYQPDLTDLTGPLTALLVTQASLTHSVRSAIGRVGAVMTGVIVASILSLWFGLSWWSLGIAIFLALVLAHLIRLGDHILETPISAMLILGVTQHDVAAEVRLVNTLIGAGVGIVFNLAFPPPVNERPAHAAVHDLSHGAARTMRQAGAELADGIDRRRVSSWLRDIHELLPLVGTAEGALTRASDARRFNPRAIRRDDGAPVIRAGLVALDRSLLAIRQMLLALLEEAPEWEDPEDASASELRRAFGTVLGDIGDCIAAYGDLTLAQADQREARARAALVDTLEMLRETRAILTELLLVAPAGQTSSWLLRGSILGGVERVLAELDLDIRARADAAARGEDESRVPPVTRRWLAAHSWTRGHGDTEADPDEPDDRHGEEGVAPGGSPGRERSPDPEGTDTSDGAEIRPVRTDDGVRASR